MPSKFNPNIVLQLALMIKQSFDEASLGYDTAAMRFFDEAAEHLVDCLPITGGEHIVDVTTGTGKVALAAARRLKNGHVTGIDLSEGMLEQAKKKAREEKLTNVSFQCADIEALYLPSDSFDGLCCGFGVFFWPNMDKGLEKIMQFVKPEGFIGITSFFNGSFAPLSDLCLDRFKKYGVNFPNSYTWERLDHPDKHRTLMKAVGLQNINSQQKKMGYYLKSADQWWEVICYSGFRGFLNQLSKEDIARYKKEHFDEIEAIADEKGIWLNVDVIFTIAFKPK